MIYSADDLQTMLERTGGDTHTVDSVDLFCRVKDQGIGADEFDRGMVAKAELTYIDGATFGRRAHHSTVVDGTTWQIVGVRKRISGFVVWALEREVG